MNATPHYAAIVRYQPSGPAAPAYLMVKLDSLSERRVARLIAADQDDSIQQVVLDALALLAIPQEIRDA